METDFLIQMNTEKLQNSAFL